MADGLRVIVLFLLLRGLMASSARPEWRLQDFPEDPHEQGPCYLFDPDSFLRDEEDAQFVFRACTEAAQYFKARRLAECRNERILAFKIAVVVVSGTAYEREREDVQRMSDRLFRRWNLGSHACNDAILVFVSVKEERIVVSLNADGDTKNAVDMLERRATELAVDLRKGRYKEAIRKSLSILTHGTIDDPDSAFYILVFVILMVLWCCGFWNRTPEDTLTGQIDARAIHQARVNRFVDRRTDIARIRGNEPMYFEEKCILCYNYFKNVKRGPYSLIGFLQNLAGTRVLGCTLKCGHRCCSQCLKRWLVMKKVCPYCRREVSDISSPVPSTVRTIPSSEAERRADRAYPFVPVEIPPPSLISFGASTTTADSSPVRHRFAETQNAELFNRFREDPASVFPQHPGGSPVYHSDVESVESAVGSRRPRQRATRTRRAAARPRA